MREMSPQRNSEDLGTGAALEDDEVMGSARELRTPSSGTNGWRGNVYSGLISPLRKAVNSVS
jgi:hypothetical protein